jgi:hypothetical protein
MVHHFISQNLDAVFVATNAPGRSAFNRIERRMAPLSRELSGLILEHDHYGSHLDSRNKTVDLELEKLNFQHAGQTLAEIWSGLTFDGFEVYAEYIEPENSALSEASLSKINSKWFSDHVRVSQYLLQIIKCSDLSCCSTPRSSLLNLGLKFLPPPIPLTQSDEGLKAHPLSGGIHHNFPSIFVLNGLRLTELLPLSYLKYQVLPYDLYCPSVSKNVQQLICKVCGMYYPSKSMLNDCHSNIHKGKGDEILFVEKTRKTTEAATESMQIGHSDEISVDLESDHFPYMTVEESLENPWEVVQFQ